ncbi:MAG: hypothetical protein AAGF49_08620, partial [Pseudomonadota bacterium]
MEQSAHLFPEHVEAFKRAARLHNVAILVRQTNIASLRWIRNERATPKRIDCKAKTADANFTRRGREYKVAGLVVDPNIAAPDAFNAQKLPGVWKYWKIFAQQKLPPADAVMDRPYLWHDNTMYQYFVEKDPDNAFYGCVKFSPTNQRLAAKVIHGDFDLYAIIDMDDPGTNIRVGEKLADQRHTRSPKFRDVQMAINGPLGLGTPMVMHGSQETYAEEHSDEPIDVFFPDGTTTTARNREEIEG